MYDKLFPTTHHFYPLQQYVRGDPPFSELQQLLFSRKGSPTDNLIYVHLPYCEKQCLFCPFHIRVKRGDDAYSTYVESLEQEMTLLASLPYVRDMDFAAVYIGGGSPSLFSLPALKKLFRALRKNFDIRADAEWTFEGEPHSLNDDELMAWLSDEKVGRVSYGVQTFDDALRRKLNIAATVDDALATLDLARRYKIGEVNVDMLYHLPGHTIADLSEDIRRIEAAAFDSIDYYYLSYFGFPRKILDDMEKGVFPARPPEELKPRMGRLIREAMGKLGYKHATDHVFTRRDHSSEYYRILWGGGEGEWRAETLALGSSARGYINGLGYVNITDPKSYAELVAAGELPLLKVSAHLDRPENRGLVFFPKFFKLRKSLLQLDHNQQEFFGQLTQAGYLVDNEEYFELTESGKDWIPNITMDLFEEGQREVAMRWVGNLMNNYRNRVAQ